MAVIHGCILSVTFHCVFGSILNANNLLLLRGRFHTEDCNTEAGVSGDGDEAESLFGWSMVGHLGDLYVGSPLAGDGRVYRCHLGDQANLPCQRLTSPPRLGTGAWFGGSLAASGKSLYSCAFRSKWENYLDGQQVGKCFVLSGDAFRDFFDFTRKNFPKTPYSPWKYYGFYGVSATVDDSGDLVIGNPTAFDKVGHESDPYKVAGTIGKVSAGTLLDATLADWVTSLQDKSKMMNTFKLTGYHVTTGQFFKGHRRSFLVSAPKADNYKGRVHICADCFQDVTSRSFVFGDRAENLVVSGDQPGEHFGSSAVACDLTGDGRDDLIVGAPHFGDRHYHNLGRAYVFMRVSTGYPVRRHSFLSPPAEMSGARFGSAVGCLGEASKKVVVGAPYYQHNGAVFLYRFSDNKLELSQTILSPGLFMFLSCLLLML